MFCIKKYDRNRVYEYAKRWSYARNPLFSDFSDIGGNCTNYASQCLFAGSCTMNYQDVFGWYYLSSDNRTASWTGVEYFFNFITENKGVGPFGKEGDKDSLDIGDFIQLGREDGYYHTLTVVGKDYDGYLVSAHSEDAFLRPLSTYSFEYARYIKIEAVRTEIPDDTPCFENLILGKSL